MPFVVSPSNHERFFVKLIEDRQEFTTENTELTERLIAF